MSTISGLLTVGSADVSNGLIIASVSAATMASLSLLGYVRRHCRIIV